MSQESQGAVVERVLDFPIPLRSGTIAWLRVPWPVDDYDLDHLISATRAGLEWVKLAGWVQVTKAPGPNSGADTPTSESAVPTEPPAQRTYSGTQEE